MQKALAGTAYLKVDGEQYILAGSLTISIQESTREGKAGLSGVAGYTESPRVPYIEVSFFTHPTLSVTALENITDSTVTAELSNGRTYILRNAWTAGEINIDAASGELTVRFEGKKMTEM